MQRHRLLAAFTELLASQGLDQAGVGQICKRAGVSRRTFYEIFDDREACFLAALDGALERIAADVACAYRVPASWRDRVRCALVLLLERLDAEPGVARMWVVETLRGGPQVLERRAAVLAQIAALVDEGRAALVDEGRGEARSVPPPPPLTGQGVVGGALSVIHARLSHEPGRSLADLAAQLMATIAHPYLGPVAAHEELTRPSSPPVELAARSGAQDPFKDLPIRFTYRTARVLGVIAADPGASNRRIADGSGVLDEGQMSRLLRRLHDCGLIENRGDGRPRGEPNAWTLTPRGAAIQLALAGKR